MRDPSDAVDKDAREFVGSWKELRNPWQIYAGIASAIIVAAVAAFWLFNSLFAMAMPRHADPPVFAYVLVPLFALITGSAAYFMREVRRSLTYPIMEIGIGLAASAQAVSPASSDLARLVALLAGIRIITDGIVRFFKLTKLRAASCDPTPSPDQ